MTANTILITGASGGIGAALAQAYAGPGITLHLCGRDAARLEVVVAGCRAQGATVLPVLFDQTDQAGLFAALEKADAAAPIGLAIFNAGIGGTAAPGALEDPAQVWNIATVDFTATLAGATLIGRRMQQRRSGQIALVGSVAGIFPLPMAPAYSAAKAGLAMFAQALGLRLEKDNVFVTLVAPGFVDTAMSQSLAAPRPFLLTAPTAARAIQAGLARRRRVMLLPWQFGVLTMLWRLLPSVLRRTILRLSLPRDA